MFLLRTNQYKNACLYSEEDYFLLEYKKPAQIAPHGFC